MSERGISLSEDNQKFFDTLAIAANRPPWMEDLVNQIQTEVIAQRKWIGIPAPSAKDHGSGSQEKSAVRLLDYACGSGELSRTLFPYVDEVNGIDLSGAMVKAYNDIAERANVPVDQMHAVEGDILVPTPKNPGEGDALAGKAWFGFDMAVMSMALHHVDSPEDAVKHLVNRLKDGGMVLLIDWVLDSVKFPTVGHSGHEQAGQPRWHDHASNVAPGSEHTITRAGFGNDEMLEMLSKAGCHDVGFIEFEEPTRLGDGEQAVMQRLFLAKGKRSSMKL
ncbi:MAG: hypothetical protein Q9218_005662 [Villophora microphyllina]